MIVIVGGERKINYQHCPHYLTEKCTLGHLQSRLIFERHHISCKIQKYVSNVAKGTSAILWYWGVVEECEGNKKFN